MDIETAFKYLGVYMGCGNRYMYRASNGTYTVKENTSREEIVVVWQESLDVALNELTKGTDFITSQST